MRVEFALGGLKDGTLGSLLGRMGELWRGGLRLERIVLLCDGPSDMDIESMAVSMGENDFKARFGADGLA